MNTENNSKPELTCIIDGHYGAYCGQVFAQRYVGQCDLDIETISILKAGPNQDDSESYWDAVDEASHCRLLSGIDGKPIMQVLVGESGDWFVYDITKVEQWEAETGLNFWENCWN
jgi:hypothetical protein